MAERKIGAIALLPIVAFIYWQGDFSIKFSPAFPTMGQCNRGSQELQNLNSGYPAVAPCVDYSKPLPPFTPSVVDSAPTPSTPSQGDGASN